MGLLNIKKAIITGPTGAVGMSLIMEFISRNIEVTAVCRVGSERINVIPQHSLVSIVECNLDSLETLVDKLSHDYDAFYHFAWDGTYGSARQDAVRQTKNIRFAVDAVKLAKKLGCKVFIGAGSQGEYGHVDGVLHPETPCYPDTGYGIAKLAAGQISRMECQQLGVRHIWGRIVSVYGPYDGKNTMVMSSIIKMLNGERQQFTKGEQIWDYIYNKDAAKAFYLMAERGKDGAVYCLGSGKPRMLKDYILAIRDAAAPETGIGIGELDYFPNQVMHLEADISNLTEDTGFISEYTFEKGIRETVEWVKSNLKKEVF